MSKVCNLNEIVKSNISLKTWKAIYKLLDKVSPVSFDCGQICGAICCNPDHYLVSEADLQEEDIGIYLLPGEEKLHSIDDDWIKWDFEDASSYFPKSWTGKVAFIKCKTPPHCPRQKRPLQCRTYPLYPYLDENNKLHLIFYPHETPYSCPLIYNKIEIADDFKKATYTVWQRLLKEKTIFDLIKDESLNLKMSEIKIIYSV